MKRREFFVLALGTLTVSLAGLAHSGDKIVIGYLAATSPQAYPAFANGFRRGLSDLGFVEGQNIDIIYKSAEGAYDRLPQLAAELVSDRVSVIFASGGLPSALAAKAATTTTPIVFSLGSDPVKFGIVESLNRPGGNATGVTQVAYQLDAKRVELLHELIPDAKLIALLVNSSSPQANLQAEDVRLAANKFGQQLVLLRASTTAEIDDAFRTLVEKKASSLIVSADPLFTRQRHQIVAEAASHSIPTIYEWREFADAGGLMSYGVNLGDSAYQAGVYVGRILKGAKPADLPVLQPTKFEFVFNQKTARALGLAIPQKILIFANEVLE